LKEEKRSEEQTQIVFFMFFYGKYRYTVKILILMEDTDCCVIKVDGQRDKK
jgi:hypothetical protein